ncbi:hypothetical protein CDAR_180431 [Caerostris darwini]|uniref:Uncharacterized protein n=1 Tax=Caerostris darwini TaxID=1538125 RepID=A0AAV4NP37_9ARAC|nr:hypothetical protein CDAR_180431 [Caerostris darwini]
MPLLHLKRIIFLLHPEPELQASKKKPASSRATAYFQFIIYQKAQIIYLGKSIFLSYCQANSGKSICHLGPAPFIVSALFVAHDLRCVPEPFANETMRRPPFSL